MPGFGDMDGVLTFDFPAVLVTTTEHGVYMPHIPVNIQQRLST
jgi:hypothetical protein